MRLLQVHGWGWWHGWGHSVCRRWRHLRFISLLLLEGTHRLSHHYLICFFSIGRRLARWHNSVDEFVRSFHRELLSIFTHLRQHYLVDFCAPLFVILQTNVLKIFFLDNLSSLVGHVIILVLVSNHCVLRTPLQIHFACIDERLLPWRVLCIGKHPIGR